MHEGPVWTYFPIMTGRQDIIPYHGTLLADFHKCMVCNVLQYFLFIYLFFNSILVIAADLPQVGVSLLQSTMPQDTPLPSPTAATTPSRSITQRSSFGLSTPKAGTCCEHKCYLLSIHPSVTSQI